MQGRSSWPPCRLHPHEGNHKGSPLAVQSFRMADAIQQAIGAMIEQFMTEIQTPVPASTPAIPEQTPWAAFIAGFGYAFAGLWHVLRTQRNARIHVVAAGLAVAAGGILHISAVEFAITFVAISSVFIAEMFNTGLEACVDLASPELHPLAKTAKDVAAGAVLASAMLAVIIGLCIFGPHVLALLTPA
jgi:diacylglycerol kinase